MIAGNKTVEHARRLGIPIQVVETDGHQLVVVQRRDLDLLTDPKARALAIADNRVGELDLDWDEDALRQPMPRVWTSHPSGRTTSSRRWSVTWRALTRARSMPSSSPAPRTSSRAICFASVDTDSCAETRHLRRMCGVCLRVVPRRSWRPNFWGTGDDRTLSTLSEP